MLRQQWTSVAALVAGAGVVAVAAADPVLPFTLKARTFQPGELIVARLAAPADATDVQVVLFNLTTPAFRVEDAWMALVGIDVERAPGDYTLRASARRGAERLVGERPVTVMGKRFVTRRLTVAPSFVNPSPEDQRRIEDDAALIQDVYARPYDLALWERPWLRPVPHAANSQFGARSVFNGAARNPHAGTDFSSPQGTPIRSPNIGLVALARDLFFTGNTVIVDHGLGVFSTFAHLSVTDVVEGQPVVTGQRLGLVGATGRVTGAHLHWGLRVGGARVDALSVLAVLGEGVK